MTNPRFFGFLHIGRYEVGLRWLRRMGQRRPQGDRCKGRMAEHVKVSMLGDKKGFKMKSRLMVYVYKIILYMYVVIMTI